ncbi:MAG: M23 family metallopeptidase [Chryseotalea sp.]
MRSRFLCSAFFILIFFISSFSQSTEKYLFPIQPGKTASLAGTMGELRTNHFHSGIDIRTNNQEGWPVHATSDGYISRIAMSGGGYGNVLYLHHTDGNVSVYAHLQRFHPKVAAYIKKEQYTKKTFEIDLAIPENLFVFKKGDTIAYAGNTGSSSGPHLHFDIRNANNEATDPFTYHFPEVIDTLPPYTEKVALLTLNHEARVNERFGRTEFYAIRKGNDYELAQPVLAYGWLGLELAAKDKLAYRSPYFGGVNFIEVTVNGKPTFKQAIDKINLTETRAINQLISFRSVRAGNNKFYKLYIDDGNALPFYDKKENNGKLYIEAGKLYDVEVKLSDVFNNISYLRFKIKGVEPSTKLPLDYSMKENFQAEYIHHTLKFVINKKSTGKDTLSVYAKGKEQKIAPTYSGTFNNTYLINLNKDFPDSLVCGTVRYVTRLADAIPPTLDYTFYGKETEIQFEKSSLYDTLYLQHSIESKKDSSRILEVGNAFVPLHKNITISWKYPNLTWQANTHVYRISGNALTFVGGSYTNEHIRFSTREFGRFLVLKDTIPPTIKLISLHTKNARFKVKDDLSGIGNIEANINGQWLLMHVDAKSGTLQSDFPTEDFTLKGEFVLVVTDRAGNKQTFKQKL